MERDSVIAHGCTMFLRERLCDQSDKYFITVCEKCGNLSTTPKECRSCGTDKVVTVRTAYIFKLVRDELAAMLIKTKITATKD